MNSFGGISILRSSNASRFVLPRKTFVARRRFSFSKLTNFTDRTIVEKDRRRNCMLSAGMSMTSGFDSDHHMEWSVNMTRHEIANLSHQGNICTSWYEKRMIARWNAKRRHDEKRQGGSRTVRKQRCGNTAVGKCAFSDTDTRTAGTVWNYYLLYRSKEIRPSNKRVLRSQFNGDLPETVEQLVTWNEQRTSEREI